MEIIIYTSENCSYCTEATKLLDSKKLRYQWIDVTNDPVQRQLLIEKSNGLRTVPQIFIDNQHIGGYKALRKMDIQGELDDLIRKYVVRT